MTFLRTVIGDVDLGQVRMAHAHEHIWLSSPRLHSHHSELVLDSEERAVQELKELADAGVNLVVDAMPGGGGRDAVRLHAISSASGVYVIASSGVHLDMYYQPEDPWILADEEHLLERFVHEIEVEAFEAEGQSIRCGAMKLATEAAVLSPTERARFRAAARAHVRTGCPILTHVSCGPDALEQASILLEMGVEPGAVVLSHLDQRAGIDLHRRLLEWGVVLEYDSCFRWGFKGSGDYGPAPGVNPTLDLAVELIPEYPHQIVFGMDAAKTMYWRSHGGQPGLRFLVDVFLPMLIERGVPEPLATACFTHSPKMAYRFRTPEGSADSTEKTTCQDAGK